MHLTDILSPIMVGPSSSHTAGTVKIGRVARKLLGEEPVKAEIFLHGSFTLTGKGHGTDRALIAGLLGMHADDLRISESFAYAKKAGLEFSFSNKEIKNAHPNMAQIKLTGKTGRILDIAAESICGGH